MISVKTLKVILDELDDDWMITVGVDDQFCDYILIKKKKINGQKQALEPDPGQEKPKRAESKSKRFGDFWDVWPKKVKKAQALKLWKSKNLDKYAEEIIAAVPKYLEYLDSQEKIKGWSPDVAHPTSWLRGERWNDDFGADHQNNDSPSENVWLNNFLKDPIALHDGNWEMAKRGARELNSLCEEDVMRVVGHKLDETLETWNQETKQWTS